MEDLLQQKGINGMRKPIEYQDDVFLTNALD
jgi:hypothetical protein